MSAATAMAQKADLDVTEQTLASGAALAEEMCSPCHAVGTSGVSPHREAPEFRKLSERYPIYTLEEALAEGIYTGHPAMPTFQFEPDEINALLGYMESIQE